MLEVDIPSVFINLNKLIEDYLNEPAQVEKKELVNSSLIIIDNILAQGNPTVTKGDYTTTALEHYIYEHCNRSHMLIIALLRPDLYDLFKSPLFNEAWDGVLIDCSPPVDKENINNPAGEPFEYTPYPHIHSLDILISNFLYNAYYSERGDNFDAFIKSMSFLAHATAYGAFPAIEKCAFGLYTYIKANETSQHKETLTFFLYQLLEEAAKAYLHLGIRLRGYYFMLMNQNRSTPETRANFVNGKQSLLIAWKFEQYADSILNAQATKLFEEKIPVISKGFFPSEKKALSDIPDLIMQYKAITDNAKVDRYYKRKFLAFEDLDSRIVGNDLLQNKKYNNFIDNAVQKIFESPSSLLDVLNDRQSSPSPTV